MIVALSTKASLVARRTVVDVGRVEAEINPYILQWALQKAGFSKRGEVAQKLGISEGTLGQWLDGEKKPSFLQAMKIASLCKRPLVFFYQQEVPVEDPTFPKFRKLPGNLEVKSPGLIYHLRLAKERREQALELLAGLGKKPIKFDLKATLDNDVDALAASLRARMGVSPDVQRSWKTKEEAFSRWRRAIESLGVLVFGIPRIPVSVFRGFCIAASPAPVIGINSDDFPAGRVFTMLHELGHLALNSSSIDQAITFDSLEERFCNALAGAILMPRESFAAFLGALPTSAQDWQFDEIKTLSKLFCVSEEAVVVRLLTLGWATQEFYKALKPKFESIYKVHKEKLAEKEGGPTYYRALASQTGKSYAQIVLGAYDGDLIGADKLKEYLGLRPSGLPKFRQEVLA